MLSDFTLYRFYLVKFSGEIYRAPIKNIDYSAKTSFNKLTLSTLFTIFLTFFTSTTIFANEKSGQAIAINQSIENLSELELYRKAKSIRRSDIQGSFLLANEGLRKAQLNKNQRLTAEIHTLLGKLSRESDNIDKSIHHFLQSSLIYKEMGDQRNQIMASVEHANTLISEKRYSEADKKIDELLPVAQKYGDDLPIALIKMTKGDGYYRQKRHNDAIAVYKEALKYLTDEDVEVQKRLALTYQKIALAYTKVINREMSITFYKHSLEIYTILNNRRSMASSYKNLSMQERYLGDYVAALDYSIHGLKIQRKLNDDKALAKMLTGVGKVYRFLERYEESIEHLEEAYQLYKQGDHIPEIAETSKEIGLIYTRLKKFDQARSFYQLAIDLPEEKVSSNTRTAALREISVIDLNIGNYGSAKSSALKAYKIYEQKNDVIKLATTARILSKINKALEDDSQTIFYAREAVTYAIKSTNKIELIKALTLLGQSLIGHDIGEAIIHLKESLKLSTDLNRTKEQLSAYRSLREAEKSRKNIVKSLYYAEKEISLTKQIYQNKEKNELVRAKAKLDSHKMEMELDLLKEKAQFDQLELARKNNEIEIAGQASKIAELELTKNRYTNIGLVALLIICLFMVFYTYRRFAASRKQNKELDYLATRDPLTNCYNRRVLFDLMNRDFSNLDLLGEYCIIMADIDHFKAVNDTHGHSAGDEVLRSVANILRNGVRKNDIAARFGGEEFCLVLPGAGEEQAIRIAEAMRQKVENTHFDNIMVTCSFGITSIKFNAKTPTEIIEQADLALYASKHNGRNKVTLWDKDLCNTKA